MQYSIFQIFWFAFIWNRLSEVVSFVTIHQNVHFCAPIPNLLLGTTTTYLPGGLLSTKHKNNSKTICTLYIHMYIHETNRSVTKYTGNWGTRNEDHKSASHERDSHFCCPYPKQSFVVQMNITYLYDSNTTSARRRHISPQQTTTSEVTYRYRMSKRV